MDGMGCMVSEHGQNERKNLVPFLAWAGGKRWFVQRHAGLLPQEFGRYIEPFLGAGSVFFHLEPQEALLGDLNAELIAASPLCPATHQLQFCKNLSVNSRNKS